MLRRQRRCADCHRARQPPARTRRDRATRTCPPEPSVPSRWCPVRGNTAMCAGVSAHPRNATSECCAACVTVCARARVHARASARTVLCHTCMPVRTSHNPMPAHVQCIASFASSARVEPTQHTAAGLHARESERAPSPKASCTKSCGRQWTRSPPRKAASTPRPAPRHSMSHTHVVCAARQPACCAPAMGSSGEISRSSTRAPPDASPTAQTPPVTLTQRSGAPERCCQVESRRPEDTFVTREGCAARSGRAWSSNAHAKHARPHV